jgi:hypothetical protein
MEENWSEQSECGILAVVAELPGKQSSDKQLFLDFSLMKICVDEKW